MKKKLTKFQFVIDKSTLGKLSVDHTHKQDWIDYYFNRMERIRFIKDHYDKSKKGNFFYIRTVPGTVYKDKVLMNKEKAESMINRKNIEYLIRKTGIGHITINNIKGYVERVEIEDVKKKKKIVDEIQIEFETFEENREMLESIIKPIRVIAAGLYDYIKTL